MITRIGIALIIAITVVHTASATDVNTALITLERNWTDLCDDTECRTTNRKAVDRLRTLLPQVDMHPVLQLLFKTSMETCVDLLREQPGMLKGMPIATFLAECTLVAYNGVLEKHGGVPGVIELYNEASKKPETEARLWSF